MTIRIYFFALLCGICSFFACNGSNSNDLPLDEQGREDFQAFHTKFYADSLFQLQRIEFPLLGNNPDGSPEPFYWEVENWRYKKLVEESKEIKRVPLFDMGDVMRERLIVQDRFMIEILFSLINNRWYLTQYSGMRDIGYFGPKAPSASRPATESLPVDSVGLEMMDSVAVE